MVTNIMMSNFELEPEEKTQINEGNVEKLTRMIINYFRSIDDELLVVFDNAEELMYHDMKGFREMVTELLDQCPSLKFLMTSRVTFGVLQDIKETIIVLQELSPGYSVDLFLSHSSRQIEDEEKRELVTYEPENIMLVGDTNQTNQPLVSNLSKHHLFKILAGNPHAIILASALLLNKKLKELYMLLNSEKLMEVLKVDGVTDSTVASLCRSLEVSIIVLQQEDQITLSFFFLIGLLPGGIFKEQLQHIWKSKQPGADFHVNKLMQLSLLQSKDQAGDKQDQQKLILPPFINNYAEQTIDDQLKSRFQQTLCEYYVSILKDLYREDYRQWANSKNTTEEDATPRRQQLEQEFVNDLRMKLIRHETNIWACVYRIAKSDQPIQVDQLELENIVRKPTQRLRRHSEMTPRLKARTPMPVGGRQRKKSSGDASNEEEKEGNNDLFDKATKKSGLSQVNEEESHYDNKSDISDNRAGLLSNPRLLKPDYFFKPPYEKDNSSDDDSDLFDNQSFTLANNSQSRQNEESPSADIKSPDSSSLEEKTKMLFKPMKKFLEEKLSSIMKNSIVTFSKSSIRHSLTNVASLFPSKPHLELNGLKGAESSPDYLDDDMFAPMKSFSHADVLQIYPGGLFPTSSSPDSHQRGILNLQDSEKLIIYYGMNLYLLRDDESALKLINKYAITVKGSSLYFANIQKILGLIHLRKVEINEAMIAFKKADDLFEKCKCIYGQALAKFSIGYIYRSNSFHQLLSKEQQSPTDSIQISAQTYLSQSLKLFRSLNHIMGQARCHEHLSLIHKKLGSDSLHLKHQKKSYILNTQFSQYQTKYKKRCPHFQRIYGQDVSLMSEIITDNEERRLFQDLSFTVTPTSSQRSMIQSKKEHNNSKLVSIFGNIEDEPRHNLYLSHQVSAPPLNLLNNSPDGFSLSLQSIPLTTINKHNSTSPHLQESKLTSSIRDDPYFGEDYSDDLIRIEEVKYTNDSPPMRPQNLMMNKQMSSPSPISPAHDDNNSFKLTVSNSAPLKQAGFKIMKVLDTVQEEEDLPTNLQDIISEDPHTNHSAPIQQMTSPNKLNIMIQHSMNSYDHIGSKSPIIVQKAMAGFKNTVIKTSKIKFTNALHCKSIDISSKTPPPELHNDESCNNSSKRSSFNLVEQAKGLGNELRKRLNSLNRRKNSSDHHS